MDGGVAVLSRFSSSSPSIGGRSRPRLETGQLGKSGVQVGVDDLVLVLFGGQFVWKNKHLI